MRALIFFCGYVPLAIFLANCGVEPVQIPDLPEPQNRAGTGTGSGGSAGTSNSGKGGGSGTFPQSGAGPQAGSVGTAGTGTAGVGQGGTTGGTGAGKAGSAGTAPTAGTAPVAGTSSSGGAGAGGTGTAGTGTAGSGMTVACETMFTVTMDGFIRAPASGGACWHGYAFGGGDTTSTVTFPGGGTDFSKSMGVLNLSGTVGSATETNMYAGNVFFGVNLNQNAGASAKATVTPAGTSLVVTYSGGAGPPMRIQLQAPGGDASALKRWCAPVTASGTAIAYSTFKTNCWEGGTPQNPYAKEPIEAVLITIPGGAADAAFDLTLTGIKEM